MRNKCTNGWIRIWRTDRYTLVQRAEIYRDLLNWENYKKQINFCVDLLRKTKTEYFKYLNVKDPSDNRKFWKTIKPYFSNNGLNSNKLLLKEKANLVSDEKELATIKYSFFTNITKDLELKKDSKGKLNNLILLKSFLLKDYEVRKFIMNLDGPKPTLVGDIPTNMLKQTVDIHLPIMTQVINMSIDNNC